jgi:hypothetical protein
LSALAEAKNVKLPQNIKKSLIKLLPKETLLDIVESLDNYVEPEANHELVEQQNDQKSLNNSMPCDDTLAELKRMRLELEIMKQKSTYFNAFGSIAGNFSLSTSKYNLIRFS